MLTPPHQFVVAVELSTYRLMYLPNMPDPSGCIQLEPLQQGHRAWLHVPLTDETRHMISVGQLCAMRRNAVLINTSRGAVVDERALIAALDIADEAHPLVGDSLLPDAITW